jgi:hypothetical protein
MLVEIVVQVSDSPRGDVDDDAAVVGTRVALEDAPLRPEPAPKEPRLARRRSARAYMDSIARQIA